ncbi:MAG: hypothetical protein PVI63_02080 [Anaerolineae bacterium]
MHSILPNKVTDFATDLVDGGTRFPVVKAVDDLGWLPGIRLSSPETILIARIKVPNEGCSGVEKPSFDMEAHARASLNVILDKISGDPRLEDVVDYWEVYNEPDPPGTVGYRRLAELMIKTMDLAEEHGLKIAIFALNGGTPEWDEMEAMVKTGVFGRAKEGEHILTLHEGTFTSHDPKKWWGDTIPGSPEVEGAGPLNFRYRYLYHLLEQRDEVIPLVVSEWYCGDEQSASTQTLVNALRWYDSEASKDYYFWAACPFTLGPTSGWKHTNYERVYPGLVAHMIEVKDRQNAAPPEQEPEPEPPECVPPRLPYLRSYILLPQIQDTLERLEWRTAAAIGSADALQTVGHSADDAGVGPPDRRITAVNPQQWGGDLRAWYEQHYPRASYRAIEAETPWEMAIRLLSDLQDDIAIGQSDLRWESRDFGEEPGGSTIGEAGCLLTGLAIILRKVYQRSVTPLDLDKLLVAARAAFVKDNLLVWDDTVSLFSAFNDTLNDDEQRSADELQTLLNGGWEILLRTLDSPTAAIEHFVYLESVEDDVLRVIDTWDGNRKQKAVQDYEGIRAAHVKESPVTPSFEVLTSQIELGACVAPREPYDRTYVLLPQLQDPVDRIQWRVAAATGSVDALQTVGHSADDAGVGPPNRTIIAVNPTLWGGDLQAWYAEHYPGAEYRAIEAENPWEMAVRILPELTGDIALAQIDDRWADYDFGEQPDVGDETISRRGCFLTALAMVLRKLYQRDVTPPVLDKLLVTARSAYVDDDLMAWAGAIPLFPAFDESAKDNQPRSAAELRQLADAGWEIILRQGEGEHFVYLEAVEDDTLYIIDSRDGQRKQKTAADYTGIRAAHIKGFIPPQVSEVLIGLHDEAGGEWMVDQGMVGCCLTIAQVQQQPLQLDFRHLQDAGIVVIARLNWGYADGTGTFPRPPQKEAFVNAVVNTMLAARGVDYFHIGNEPNNRQEWPGFGGGNEFALTPEYVTEIYNDIWRRVPVQVKMGPPPIDPYYGPGSNNREWWTYILGRIEGADALFLHSKTQTNDPDEVWSKAKFSDWPLQWQYLHLRTVETSLEVVPERFQALPVFVTEVNPQYLDVSGGNIGWKPDNAAWVREAVRYFREERPVTGIVFYRYRLAGDQAPFGLENKPLILGAIEDETKSRRLLPTIAARQRPRGILSRIWRRIVEVIG